MRSVPHRAARLGPRRGNRHPVPAGPLPARGGRPRLDGPPGDGGGVIGTLVCAPLMALLGMTGAAIVLFLLLVVGFLLFFNMTIGDVFTAWSHRQTEVGPPGGRGASAGSVHEAGRVTRIDRAAPEDPPLILRRQRAEPGSHVGRLPGRHRRGRAHRQPATGDRGGPRVGRGGPPGRGGGAGSGRRRARKPPRTGPCRTSPAGRCAGQRTGPDGPHGQGQRIKATLASFDIGVKVARIQEGPVVTQYALDVDPGIKLSRIQGLADNLALALSARSIRIQAPIPASRSSASRSRTRPSTSSPSRRCSARRPSRSSPARVSWPSPSGQDVAGQPVAADLGRMPHLLIAGATGSGKSVCVNALICSLVMRPSPTR